MKATLRKANDDELQDGEMREGPESPAPYPIDEALEDAYAASLVIPTTSEAGRSRARPREAGDGGNEPAEPGRIEDGAADAGPVEPADMPPESLEERLRELQPWKASFVLKLMECGGVLPVAALRQRVSMRSVEAHLQSDPAFAKACKEAVSHSNGVLEAAIMKGATIGDLGPVYQGGELVGYKRVRSPKDAELALKLRGMMPDQNIQVTHGGRVELARDEEIPGILADVLKKMLFGSKPAKRPPVTINADTGKLADA
jgi:hypothetical protein